MVRHHHQNWNNSFILVSLWTSSKQQYTCTVDKQWRTENLLHSTLNFSMQHYFAMCVLSPWVNPNTVTLAIHGKAHKHHLPNPSSSTNGTSRQSSLSVISSGWLWCTENLLCRSNSLKPTTKEYAYHMPSKRLILKSVIVSNATGDLT